MSSSVSALSTDDTNDLHLHLVIYSKGITHHLKKNKTTEPLVVMSLKVAPKKPVCWFTWVILGVWPVLALLGVLIQWKVTAEGFSHTEGKLQCAHTHTLTNAHTQPKQEATLKVAFLVLLFVGLKHLIDY